MGRKSEIDKALEAGSWEALEKKSRKALRKANIKTLLARGGRLPIESSLIELLGTPREEAKDHGVTLGGHYEQYREGGGNRSLPDAVLESLGDEPIEDITRKAIRAVAHKLYSTEVERAELVYDPLEEIIGVRIDRKSEPPPTGEARNANPGAYDPYAYWLEQKAGLDAHTKALEAVFETLADHNARFLDRKDILIDEQGNVWGSKGPDWPHWDETLPPAIRERGDMVGVLKTKRGRGGVHRQVDYYTPFEDRTPFEVPLKQNKFGDYDYARKADEERDARKRKAASQGRPFRPGRPRQPNKLSNAEKQHRYRQRKKLKGKP